jgi:hypothetical protein
MSTNRAYRRHGKDLLREGVVGRPATDLFVEQRHRGFYPMPVLADATNALVAAGARTESRLADELKNHLSLVSLQYTAAEDVARKYYYATGLHANEGAVLSYLDATFLVPAHDAGVTAVPEVRGSVPGDWSCGITSSACFYGDGYVQFRVQAGKSFIVGLSEGGDPTVPGNRLLGFLIQDGLVTDLVRGFDGHYAYSKDAGAPAQTTTQYAVDDTTLYEASLRGGTLTLKVGGSTHASYAVTTPAGVWSLGACLFYAASWIEGVAVHGYVTSAGALPGLRGIAGQNPAPSGGRATLSALTGSGRNASGGMASLPAARGFGGRQLGSGALTMPVLTGRATAYAASISEKYSLKALPMLTASSGGRTGVRGLSAATLPGLKGFAAKGAKAVAAGTLTTLQTLAAAEGLGTARAFSVFDDGGAWACLPTFLAFAASAGGVSTTVGTWKRLDATLMSAATAATSVALRETLLAQMITQLLVVGPTTDSGDAGLAWLVNIANSGVSTYESYSFNSFGTLGGKNYGMRSDGLYLLEGDDDDGDPVRATVSFGAQDFNSKSLKNPLRAYIGISGAGTMYLRIRTNGGQEYTYQARATANAPDTPAQIRFDVGRGLRANYFIFDLYNGDGADFELDSASFFAVDVLRRI